MIHVVAVKCLIGLPLLIHIELLWSRSRSFKNRGVGVGTFVYRLHSPGFHAEAVHHLNFDINVFTYGPQGSKVRTFSRFHERKQQFALCHASPAADHWAEGFADQ
jgi:hypothetical protein